MHSDTPPQKILLCREISTTTQPPLLLEEAIWTAPVCCGRKWVSGCHLPPAWTPGSSLLIGYLFLSFFCISNVFSLPFLMSPFWFLSWLESSFHLLWWVENSKQNADLCQANLLSSNFRWILSPCLILYSSDCSRHSFQSRFWKEVSISAFCKYTKAASTGAQGSGFWAVLLPLWRPLLVLLVSLGLVNPQALQKVSHFSHF